MKTKKASRTLSILGILVVVISLYGCVRFTGYISSDGRARREATLTAFVATAVAQGTQQPLVVIPTIDNSFYATQSVIDSQNAQTSLADSATHAAQVGTAVAQGTPATYLISPTVDLLAKLQQTSLAETAIAQGTPAASISTYTPAPTFTPQPTATFISLPSVPTDWYASPYTGPFLNPIKALGGEDLVNKAVVALVSIISIVILFSLKSIGRGLYGLGSLIWNLSRRLNKDYNFERVYLDWMIGQYRHLGMLPAQVAARRWGERQQLVDLEQIYTRLSLSGQADDEDWNSQINSKTRWAKVLPPPLRAVKAVLRIFSTILDTTYDALLAAVARIVRSPKPSVSFDFDLQLNKWFPEPKFISGSLSLIIDRTPRLVIKGDPGSGKTTLMRYLAISCARALRNNEEEGDSKHMVFDRLSWGKKPYPIMIRLSRHADVIQWGDGKSLIDAFKDELPLDLRRRCPEGFFVRLLDRKPCLILLDAFDELGSPNVRSMMAEYVNGFLEIYGKGRQRVIVTTRVVGYEGQLDRLGFQSRTVQPLQQEERKSLIHLRYKAYTLVEKLGRTPAEARSIESYLQQREQALIARIETMPRLAQLATNPMLLSLITLVHFLKVELPDERVLLYRDCVEILTERWQRYKREETGRGSYPTQELTLAQKTKLLQELAFAMQRRRDPTSSQALLSKRVAVTIISDALVRFFGNDSNGDELTRRAEEWIMGIQTDSGILLEQGLDQDGEPLIGFSHLTFQEYLAAVAINEDASYLIVLMKNLLNPAWREVIRLYVVLADDSTPVISVLSAESEQYTGYILAGWCITERLKKVDAGAINVVKNKLTDAFRAENSPLDEISEIMEKAMAVLNVVPFLLEQVTHSNFDKQIAAIHALRGIQMNDAQLLEVKALMISTMDTSPSVKVRIAAQEALSRIGDPRFESHTPFMVKIPSYPLDGIRAALFDSEYSPYLRRGFISRTIAYFGAWLGSMNSSFSTESRFNWQRRYIFWRKYIERSKTYVDEFEIARFPVTNLEYSRFVNETAHLTPLGWDGGSYSSEKALHPVTGVKVESAYEYCRWLSEKTGDNYQLPLEWEWEAAAGLLDGNIYPWGNEFDPANCNSGESKLLDTTPVGIYHNIRSLHGVQDTSGNVREYIRISPLFSYAMLLLWIVMPFILTFVVSRQVGLAAFMAFTIGTFTISSFGADYLASALRIGGLTKGGAYLDGEVYVKSFTRRSGDQNTLCGFRVARYEKKIEQIVMARKLTRGR